LKDDEMSSFPGTWLLYALKYESAIQPIFLQTLREGLAVLKPMNNDMFQREDVIPLYYQLEVNLRNRLASGEFAPGDSLPSEGELGRQYAVSRITVRQALETLKRDGLISRQRGRGTFVTERVQRLWTPKLTGALEDASGPQR